VNILSVKGIYNAATPALFCVNGWYRIHTALLANTDNPCFKIETDAITDEHPEVVLAFEKESRGNKGSKIFDECY
jgi:hypothetical protein